MVLLRPRHYCGVPEANIRCLKIEGSHLFTLNAQKISSSRCFSMYNSRIECTKQMSDIGFVYTFMQGWTLYDVTYLVKAMG